MFSYQVLDIGPTIAGEYYLVFAKLLIIYLNTSDINKENSSENSESYQDCSKNSCENTCLENGNGTSK